MFGAKKRLESFIRTLGYGVSQGGYISDCFHGADRDMQPVTQYDFKYLANSVAKNVDVLRMLLEYNGLEVFDGKMLIKSKKK